MEADPATAVEGFGGGEIAQDKPGLYEQCAYVGQKAGGHLVANVGGKARKAVAATEVSDEFRRVWARHDVRSEDWEETRSAHDIYRECSEVREAVAG